MELDLINCKPSYMWVFEQVPYRCHPSRVANTLWWLSEKGYKAWLRIEYASEYGHITPTRKRKLLVLEAKILIARDRVNELIKYW